MSTLPRDPTLTADTAVVSPMRPGHDLEAAAAREFVAMAEEQGTLCLPEPELRELIRQVADLTAEIFGGDMEVEVLGDPEIRGELHFTFEVAARGAVDEIVARENEWHLKVRRLVGTRAELFRFSVDAR